MSVTVADITALKTIRADTGTLLRFVNSKLSWYQSTPSSSATDDGDLVIAPNIGTGRWLKQFSSFISGLTPTTVTSNTTAAIGVLYNINATGGGFTITLPATAPSGALVAFYAREGVSSVNRLAVNVNGRKVNGSTNNREILFLGAYVELKYLSDTDGWIITNQNPDNCFINLQTPFSATYSGTPGDFTNNIIHYLGRQKNTLSYQAPHSSVGGRTVRHAWYFGGSGGTLVSLSPNNASTANFITSPYASAVRTPPPIIWDFLSTGGVRVEGLHYTVDSTRATLANGFPANFQIWGANTLLNSNIVSGNANLTAINNHGEAALVAAFSQIDLIWASGWNSNSFFGSAVTVPSTSHLAVIITGINSTKYYRYIIFTQTNNQASSQANLFFFSHIDLLGDVITA